MIRRTRRVVAFAVVLCLVLTSFFLLPKNPLMFLSKNMPLTYSDLADTTRAGVGRSLQKVGLRPLGWKETADESFFVSPVSDLVTEAQYSHSEDIVGYASRKLTDEEFTKSQVQCGQIRYRSGSNNERVEVTKPRVLEDPSGFHDLWNYLEQSGYSKLVKPQDAEHWYRFSGSAVWMPGDNCYLMVTRYIYAPTERDVPVLSLCRLQAFDSKWAEIPGKRIRYVDVTSNKILAALRKYLRHDKDDSMLDAISLKMPAFMDVPIQQVPGRKAVFLGPEDPRIVYRENSLMEDEPIITFNELTESKDRLIHAAFPLRKPVDGKLRVVALRSSLSDRMPLVEKNWSPFFERGDGDFQSGSLGFAHFIYDLGDITIVRCDFDTGKCKQTSREDEDKKDSEDGKTKNSLGKVFIRGGTNIVAVPEVLQRRILRPKRTKGMSKNAEPEMWFGISKTHDEECSCGKSNYRPNMFILYKNNGLYRMEMVTESSNLGIDITAWSADGSTACDGLPNVLSPNSIAFWSVHEGAFGLDDYLALTISLADHDTQLVFLKGVASYIDGLYRENAIQADDSLSAERAAAVIRCALQGSYSRCEAYAKTHKMFVELSGESGESGESAKAENAENAEKIEEDAAAANAEKQA